jgi:micrococcal nuclease
MMRRSVDPVVVLTLVGAASVGAFGALAVEPGGLLASLFISPSAAAVTGQISGCTVTDGDTIRCGAERIRLLGIDAPELPGHCRNGRVCAPGDGQASKRSLTASMTGSIAITRLGIDRYGRTLAIVLAGGVNLSCRQLERRQAIYKQRWDNGGQVASACPRVAR